MRWRTRAPRRRAVREKVVVRGRAPAGYSAIELLFGVGLVLTLCAVAVPQSLVAVERYRLHGAVRYLTGHLQRLRLDAIVRSVNVGLRFSAGGNGYTMTAYLDGNGNGIRTADIESGVDPPVGSPVRLPEHFQGVDFGLHPGLPPVGSGMPPAGDPIKLGSTDILTFTPLGASSSGSLYVRGASATQAVVRVYGATGKLRALELDRAAWTWVPF